MSSGKKKYRYDVEPVERPPVPSLAPIIIGGVVIVVVGLILMSVVQQLLSFLIGLAITGAIVVGLAWVITRFVKKRTSS